MQGELLGESSGTITGIRVLSTEGPDSKIEAVFQGAGNVLGTAIRDFGTYEQVFRPGGTVYGEGRVLMLTEDGKMLPWRGFGVGQPLPGGAVTFGVAGSFEGAPDSFDRLNNATNVIEYEVEGDNTYHWRMWEWKGGRAG